MRTLVIFFATTATLLAQATPPATISYRFDEVRSHVVLAREGGYVRARKGTEANGGDVVRTGTDGFAIIALDARAARFEVFASSEVRLARSAPGVLVSLEEGRIKAIFDAWAGSEPRLVRTPGALLAARGTRFGVEVAPSGETTLTVFEGTVGVHSGLRPEPLLVKAGEVCLYSRAEPPATQAAPEGMTEERWNDPSANEPPASVPVDRT